MGPLAGLRIVEMSGIGPGPVCGMLLADLGAEVTVVDRKGAQLQLGGSDPKVDLTRRGKRSVALDLKMPGATEVVLKLIDRADGLIEGYRPGVMERLGLGPEVCLARNPRLVFGRLTGWGQTGPLAPVAGHDLNYVALTGILHHTGRPEAPPSIPATIVGDVGGGAMFMALGLVSGMLSARTTGRGQVVDAAIVDGCAVMSALIQGARLMGRWSDRRYSNFLDGAAHWYDSYQCSDGRWVTVGALEPQFYQLLLEKLGLQGQGLEQAHFDTRRWPELKEKFTAIFRTRSQAEWCALLEGTDVCFAPVLTIGEAMEHPHHQARGTYREVHGIRQPMPAPRFSATPGEIGRAAVAIGADTQAVLATLGYTDAASAQLLAAGVI
ncbi:MAG TPA: CaiB/BaiF CoA-transferase family protein [Steroidobacteraceae bacterium]